MFSLNDSMRYWIYSEPTDMRKSFYTLSVLAEIILGKFLYHLPFYRQINRFREFGIRLPASTVGD